MTENSLPVKGLAEEGLMEGLVEEGFTEESAAEEGSMEKGLVDSEIAEERLTGEGSLVEAGLEEGLAETGFRDSCIKVMGPCFNDSCCSNFGTWGCAWVFRSEVFVAVITGGTTVPAALMCRPSAGLVLFVDSEVF